MASLLNNASLLLNPAGSIISYQEDKIYSVLPKDGTGDFTFSGGDGGTRVNQQGYIEVTPANLNTYSEKFGNGYWANFGGTITDDSVVAPNGTVTGTTYNGSPAGTYKTFPGIVPGQVYTVSAYVKLGTATNCVFIVNNTQAWNTVGGKSFTSADGLNTTDWTRISFTFTGPAYGAINWHIGYQFESGVTQQTNGTYFVWGAMLNQGSTALPYQPTTDRLNYPRITYQNGRGAVLNEPQRTNLWVQSQNFATYGVYRFTQTLNAAISPDGTQNASKIVETATAGTHQYEPSFSATSGQAYTVSVFAKAAERTQLHIFAFADNGVFNNTDAFYDLAAGTVISGTGASIEKWPDGWYRCIRTMTAGATGAGYWGIGIAVNGGASYTGDGSSGIYMWGGQNEAGSLPTSYIPTTSATVTRPGNTDYPYVGNIYQNGIVGQNNFTVYGDIFPQGSANTNLNGGLLFADSTYANYIFVGSNTSGTIYTDGSAGSSYQFAVALGAPGRYKIAANCSNGLVKIFANGVLQKTFNNSNFVNSNTTQYRAYHLPSGNTSPGVGNSQFFLGALYNTALTDAQCQELTTVRSGSGGNISYYGPYTIHTFTGSATFTPSFTGPVEVLVVAGGGGGGSGFFKSACGGGGGAGGLQYVSSYGVSAGTGITVTIGAGGAGGPQGATYQSGYGTNGSNSIFGGLTSTGGGGGTTYLDADGLKGGSGGGAGGAGGYTPVGGQGITGQGNNGGNQVGAGQSTDTTSCGGGGGAGAVGANGVTSQRGGNGGIGLPYSISGFSTYYAGGGGGGASLVGGGFGGLGGGGNGGKIDSDGSNGVAYTGGGGGGASSGPGNAATGGGTGGSGIVIVRYLT